MQETTQVEVPSISTLQVNGSGLGGASTAAVRDDINRLKNSRAFFRESLKKMQLLLFEYVR